MAKLLIIDDDKEVTPYLKEFFETRGCYVITALTGEEGFRAFEKHSPNLILLDIKLPDINGLEILKKIKDKERNAFVVMFSALTDDATAKTAQSLGADGFIGKPFNMLELESTVSKMLGKTHV